MFFLYIDIEKLILDLYTGFVSRKEKSQIISAEERTYESKKLSVNIYCLPAIGNSSQIFRFKVTKQVKLINRFRSVVPSKKVPSRLR